MKEAQLNSNEEMKDYFPGSIWQDTSSFRKDDECYDFYMKFPKEWRFYGRQRRFSDLLPALRLDANNEPMY